MKYLLIGENYVEISQMQSLIFYKKNSTKEIGLSFPYREQWMYAKSTTGDLSSKRIFLTNEETSLLYSNLRKMKRVVNVHGWGIL